MFNIFKNLPLKIISLVLAILMWVIIIASQQTPYQFTEELDIKPFNLSEQLSIVTALPKVKIKIIANKEILPKLTKQDFEAYIDLKSVNKGKHTLNVFVAPKTSNVTVASIQPSQVTVDIEGIAQKQVPVITSAKGIPVKGYKIEKLIIRTDKVQIKGAESLIAKTNEVKAIVYLDGTEDANFQKEIVLQALNQNGAEIKEISIEPRNIKVDVYISQALEKKTVKVKAVLKGSPKEGFIGSIELDPSAIDIAGEKQAVENLEYIETASVDISDSTLGITAKYVPLNIPKNINLVDENKNRIKVTIEIKSN